MSVTAEVLPDTYLDSVLLLGLTRAMGDVDGVEWSAALMGTPANLEALRSEGVEAGALDGVAANDLVLAARAPDTTAVDEALARARDRARGAGGGARPGTTGPATARPRTLEESAERLGDANVAVVSVPGPYAALESHKALSRGLHVLLFSDNVSLEDEVALKERAVGMGRLLMGPGAGTAMLGGTGLGFANAVRPGGRVAVLAAAGTGAQEAMTLLERWGPGVSQVIGLGGRELSDAVGGRVARLAIELVDADPASEAVLVVSKPPAPAVAESVLGAARTLKPLVTVLIGLDSELRVATGVTQATSLEGGALAVLDRLGTPRPDLGADDVGLGRRCSALEPGRQAVRGLFSGGTLCYESLVLLSRHLGPVHSNTPLRPDWGLPAPPGAHVCLDLGEEEFTRGRPHPMIDAEARVERIAAQGDDPDVAVVLLDVVLGYGSHPDPASVLAPACAVLTDRPGGPAVVVYILGTASDPQNYDGQRRRFAEAGCVLPTTGARAALAAAALAARRPELAQAPA